MQRSIFRYTLLILALFILSGCGVKKNIPLSEQFWQEKPKVVIAHYKQPMPGMTVSGQQGLLEMAITGVANHSIIKRIKQADLSWYPKLTQEFAKQLKQRCVETIVDPTPITTDKGLLARAQGDKLLTIKLLTIGIRREYSMGLISSGAPQAYCVLMGELIDPNNQKQPLWRSEIEIMQPIQEPWDQAPHFSNVMEALNQATEAARTELLDSFFSGH